MSSPIPDPDSMPSADQLRKAAAEGVAYKAPPEAEPKPIPYRAEDPVCTLTLDQKQAWVLMILLHPYAEVEGDEWDLVLAANDISRRIREALGYE